MFSSVLFGFLMLSLLALVGGVLIGILNANDVLKGLIVIVCIYAISTLLIENCFDFMKDTFEYLELFQDNIN